MRADRLIATLLLLQARQQVTCAQVAAELEVSERTARRDLDALSVAGVPVYATRGRGGGWRLLGGARTDLSGLTADEARALFLATGPAAATSPELAAALRKLTQALPAPFRPGATAAGSSILVDGSDWGATERPRSSPPFLDALQRAVVDRAEVRLDYVGRTGGSTARTVHPLGLVLKRTTWYLLADTDVGRRTFRVGRVRAVEPTGDPATRPADFDLGVAWQQVVSRVDELRTPVRVEVAADADVVDVLRWQFGRTVVVGETRPDGRVAMVLSGRSLERVAAELAGWGGQVVVIGPSTVREHLAVLGRQLVEAYASG